MFNIANAFAFLALAFIVFTIIRTKRRVKRMSDKPFQSAAEMRNNFEQKRNEDHVVRLVELSREIEARIQNRAVLIEKLIEQADEKIKTLESLQQQIPQSTPSNRSQTNPIVEEVIKLSKEGKNDKDIGLLMNRSEGEIRLMRSLGLHAEQSN